MNRLDTPRRTRSVSALSLAAVATLSMLASVQMLSEQPVHEQQLAMAAAAKQAVVNASPADTRRSTKG